MALLFAGICRAAVPLFGISEGPGVLIADNREAVSFNAISENSITRSVRSRPTAVTYFYSPGILLSVDPRASAHRALLLFQNSSFLSQHYDLSGNNSVFSFESVYAMSRLRWNGTFAFRESNQLTHRFQQEGMPVERDAALADFDGAILLGDRLRADFGFRLREEDFLSEDLMDRSSFSLPADLYFKFSPKVALGGGYRFRQTDLENGLSFDDHFFNVGLQGRISPKLRGDFKVGFQNRELDGRPVEDSNLTILSNLSWTATSKATLRASYEKDLATGRNGSTIVEEGASVAVNYALTPVIVGNLDLRYASADYLDGTGREDEYLNAALSLSYSPSDFVRFSAGYIYQYNDSSLSGFSFENEIVNFSASLRY